MDAAAAFIDANSAAIGLVLLLLLLVGFVLERFPPVVVAAAGVALAVMLGFIGAADTLAVFSNPAPITIAALGPKNVQMTAERTTERSVHRPFTDGEHIGSRGGWSTCPRSAAAARPDV